MVGIAALFFSGNLEGGVRANERTVQATGAVLAGEFYPVVASLILFLRNLKLFLRAKIDTQAAAFTVFFVYDYPEFGVSCHKL